MINSIFQKGISIYQRMGKLDTEVFNDIPNISNSEKKFDEVLRSAEQNYLTGKITRSINPTSNVSKLTTNTINNLTSVLNKTEDLSAKTLNKSASVAETVATAMHAEAVIKTIVSVRDKLLSSYQEILRMNI